MATQKQQNKVSKVMREFYSGKLTTHGNKVTDVSQAKAIALSEAGVSKKKKKGAKKAKRKYAKGGMVESEINELYKKSKFINDDFNWKLKLMEMIQDRSIEAYNIYQSLTKEQKEEVLQEQFEVDNDMGSDGDGDIETTKENLSILLEDAKNGKKYAQGGSTSNIPKSLIDKINEINSLIKWAEDKDNFVGGYFGGTYYEYLDFEKPIETKNQFVYIEYNHGGGRKSSDRYNVNKKGEFDSNGLAELKSELSRILSAFRRAKKKYEQKGYFGEGGDVEKQNKEMVHSQVKEAKHHSEELSDILKEDKDIEAWVVAKMERATTDLSDVTHYLDGKDKSFARGGGFGKEILDEEFWKDIAHLWRSSHIDIDENGRWFNTGKYKGVNNTSGFYFTNESADLIVGLANSYKVNLSDVKRNNPDFTAFDYYKNDFEQKRNKKYASGGGVDDYTKSLGIVQVKFSDPKYNYETSVSGDITESEARKYFVGKMFDVGSYPKENMQKAIDIEFYPKGTYASGGGVDSGNKVTIDKIDKIVSSKNGNYLTISQYDEIQRLMLSNKHDLLNDEENWKSLPSNLTELIEDSEMYYGFTENEIKEFLKKVNSLGYTFNYVDVATQDNGEFSHTVKPYALRKIEYGTGGGVDHECKCDEGGVYNNPFLKSIFGI